MWRVDDIKNSIHRDSTELCSPFLLSGQIVDLIEWNRLFRVDGTFKLLKLFCSRNEHLIFVYYRKFSTLTTSLDAKRVNTRQQSIDFINSSSMVYCIC